MPVGLCNSNLKIAVTIVYCGLKCLVPQGLFLFFLFVAVPFTQEQKDQPSKGRTPSPSPIPSINHTQPNNSLVALTVWKNEG